MKKRFLPLVCFIGTILFTILASIVPLNGVTQADISNTFFTVITPAAFTFSIWTIIYLFWFISSLLIAFKDIKLAREKKILFSIAMVMTTFWLMAWHFSHVGLSLGILIVLLLLLMFLFFDSKDEDVDWRLDVTIEMTMGWVLVATLLNLVVFIKSLEFPPAETLELSIGITALLSGLVVNLFFLYKYSTYISTFIYIWALYGIWVEQPNTSIKVATSFIAIILILNFIYTRKRAYRKALKKVWTK